LSHAAESGEPAIVSLLLQAGASVSAGDLRLAQKNENLKNHAVMKELRRKAK